MALRLLHTADWHLGHSLHDMSREYEHDRFLEWLLDTLSTERIDCLVIAGDIFDVANPSSAAQRQWYRFLRQARQRMKALDIVAIAGNHDSAARLEAPLPLLEELRIHVVGKVPRNDGGLDLDRLLIPLTDSTGDTTAWCLAVPFLRPSDLPRVEGADDDLVEGVRALYTQLIEEAQSKCEAGQALVVTGHCYMKTATLSELSERKILGGNQHALPADIFSDAVSYVALGHLHYGQAVAGHKHIRYSGSPIPLSMDEVGYKHQVAIATFDGGSLTEVQTPEVRRSVGLKRIPKDGPQEREAVLALLAELPAAEDESPAPYLEVRVRMERPDSSLRRLVTEALEGKHARFVKLTVEYTGSGKSLAQQLPKKQLQDLQVEDVFRQLYASRYEGEPSEDLMECFHAIVESVDGGAT